MNAPLPEELTEEQVEWLVSQGKSVARRDTDSARPNWHVNFTRGVLAALMTLAPKESPVE